MLCISNSQCLSDSQAGYHYLNRPFYVNRELSIRLARQFLKIICETKFTNSLFSFFVTPERFELSTPGLKDRCSNHLSYGILFVILEGFEPSIFGVVNQRSIQLSYKIIFCNPRRTRTFNLRRIRPMLQPIELWDYFNLVNGQLLIHLACQFLKSFCEIKFTFDHSHFWVSSGIEPCSPVPQTDALPNKLKKP